MRVNAILILLISFLLLIGGCNKDQEVSDLEAEVKSAESIDYLADSVTEPEEAVAAEDEIAMTPEVAPEEEAPSTEMPKRMETEGFTVQVASSTNVENTQLLVEKYAERGYEAFVTEAIIEGETFYRIRIGVFETYAQADELGLELKDKYSIAYWIDNN